MKTQYPLTVCIHTLHEILCNHTLRLRQLRSCLNDTEDSVEKTVNCASELRWTLSLTYR